MPKFFKLVLYGLILAALLGACSGGKEPTYDISEYLSAFTAMDYETMFNCTEAAVENTGDDYDTAKETFVSKYTAIFTGLDVKEITIENLVGPDADGGYTYTATYKTTDYGNFTNNFVLETCTEEGTCYVLWDYSLIFPEMEEGCEVLVRTEEAQRGERIHTRIRFIWTSPRCRISLQYPRSRPP
jgi:hypothetical protein